MFRRAAGVEKIFSVPGARRPDKEYTLKHIVTIFLTLLFTSCNLVPSSTPTATPASTPPLPILSVQKGVAPLGTLTIQNASSGDTITLHHGGLMGITITQSSDGKTETYPLDYYDGCDVCFLDGENGDGWPKDILLEYSGGKGMMFFITAYPPWKLVGGTGK